MVDLLSDVHAIRHNILYSNQSPLNVLEEARNKINSYRIPKKLKCQIFQNMIPPNMHLYMATEGALYTGYCDQCKRRRYSVCWSDSSTPIDALFCPNCMTNLFEYIDDVYM